MATDLYRRPPLVSSITASFNAKKYLRGFLERLPQQTLVSDLEVVLDHNEPDEEEIAWVRDFQAQYPGRLKHRIVPKVDPIGKSWNSCLDAASADLVTIWNVDDLRTPDSIERQVRVFHERPDTDIVYGDWAEVKAFGSTDGRRVSTHGYAVEQFARSFLFGPFFMFRKALCQRAGIFDEQLVSGADFDLAVRLVFHGIPRRAEGLLGYFLNEGLGASTGPGNRMALEATVISMRYGIFDKVDYRLLPQALGYQISRLRQRGQWCEVANFVPNFDELYSLRSKNWLSVGIKRSALHVVADDHPRIRSIYRALRRTHGS